jgi:hypothetical protein
LILGGVVSDTSNHTGISLAVCALVGVAMPNSTTQTRQQRRKATDALRMVLNMNELPANRRVRDKPRAANGGAISCPAPTASTIGIVLIPQRAGVT